MFSVRTAFCWVVAVGFLSPILQRPVRGDVGGVGQMPGVQVADLQEQLEDGLKARRPQEFQFIARVVTMVQGNQLPLELVKSTFHWARKKAKHNKYPFPYFERALRERAAKLGITI